MSSRTHHLNARRLAILLAVFSAASLEAQAPSDSLVYHELVTPSSQLDRWERRRQLLGLESTDGYLLRATSTASRASRGGLDFALIRPDVEAAWNSEIPFSLNDGDLWSGRGLSTSIRIGGRADWGPLSIIVAPQLSHYQNLDTPVIAADSSGYSAYASPWHAGTEASLDLPIRFGNAATTLISPGQSSITLTAGPLAIGAATESLWWGPGRRNGIVMSDNAGGIPHAFARTARPIDLRIARVEARVIAGVLSESLYFDRDTANDYRSFSGGVITVAPMRPEGLTLGLARGVIGAIDRPEDFYRDAGDVFTRWDEPIPLVARDRDEPLLGSDQVFSLFGRWVFPNDGVELYGEWAWLETPRSVRQLLQVPNYGRGYTVGAQWVGTRSGSPIFQLSAEATTLERSPAARQRPTASFYLGRTTAQGYTQRGQIIGAAVGPGGSGQWVEGRYLFAGGNGSVGATLGRIRWENDIFYTRPLISRWDHDVTVLASLVGSWRGPWLDVDGEMGISRRFNYLFQHAISNPVRPRPAVDLTNALFRLTVSPRLGGL